MHYFLGMPLPEVASTLGIPLGTAKSRLHRSLGAMRVSIAADEAAPGDPRSPEGSSHDADRTLRPAAPRRSSRDLAEPRTPDYFDDLLWQTARTSQRPAWTLLERWLPMADIARQPALRRRCRGARSLACRSSSAAPRRGPALVTARSRKLPPPFGLARNGLVVYAQDGDIYTADPATGVGHGDRDRPGDRPRPDLLARRHEARLRAQGDRHDGPGLALRRECERQRSHPGQPDAADRPVSCVSVLIRWTMGRHGLDGRRLRRRSPSPRATATDTGGSTPAAISLWSIPTFRPGDDSTAAVRRCPGRRRQLPGPVPRRSGRDPGPDPDQGRSGRRQPRCPTPRGRPTARQIAYTQSEPNQLGVHGST